jgi:hypothetical protein
MKLFKITYNGSGLGGRAIVTGYSKEEAIDTLKASSDPRYIEDEFSWVEAEEIFFSQFRPQVIYNDNGYLLKF